MYYMDKSYLLLEFKYKNSWSYYIYLGRGYIYVYRRIDPQGFFFLFFFTAIAAAITGCSSQNIQITPKEKELVREERSKYGVTCSGPNLSEFQWRGPAGIISQSPQFRWVTCAARRLFIFFWPLKTAAI